MKQSLFEWLESPFPPNSQRKALRARSFASARTSLATAASRCVTKCTGYCSQIAARKAGLKECESLAYRDYRFEDRSVFAAIESPHTDLILSNEHVKKQRLWIIRTLIVAIALAGRTATARAQIGVECFQPLVRTSAERLAIGRRVALAKWDTDSPVTDTTREEQVILSAIKEGESYHLKRKFISDFFRAQIEANKLVQYSLLADWYRAGRAPTHKPIDLSGLRARFDELQTELIKELANSKNIRANAECHEYVAKAIGKYQVGKQRRDRLEIIALDRAQAATCCDE
jgi:chorismate mutase